eukprot:1552634-Prymnesium_polylepis.1
MCLLCFSGVYGSVRLLASSRSVSGAVIKVARRTALHVLGHDVDRTTCMEVTIHIGSSVSGVKVRAISTIFSMHVAVSQDRRRHVVE